MSNKIYVFEAPIDMLSYITMHKENWEQHSYVCLGGVAIDALKNALKTNPQIAEVYLCLDNDKAGYKTTERIGRELDEDGVWWDRIVPDTKDWNQDLTERREQEEKFNLML